MNQKHFANVILVVVIIMLVGAVGYFVFVKKAEPTAQQPTPISTAHPSPAQTESPKQTPPVDKTTGWKTYSNSNGGFEFKYPNNFTLRNGDHPDFPQGSFLKAHGGVNASAPIIATAILSQGVYPGTNFVSAWLAVADDSVIANTVDCRDFEQNGTIQQLSQTQTVNGISWYGGVTGGAAAGTILENRVYHVLHNEICYEVDLNLATTNIGNYEPGTVKAVNATEIWNTLTDIFATFSFTK